MDIHSGDGGSKDPAQKYRVGHLSGHANYPNYSNLRPGVPLISNKIVRVENTLAGIDRQKLFQAIKSNSPYAKKLQAKFGSVLKRKIPITGKKRSPPESNESSSNPVSILLTHHQPRFPADLSLLNIGEEPIGEGSDQGPFEGQIGSPGSHLMNVVNSTDLSYDSPLFGKHSNGGEMKIVASNVKAPPPLVEVKTDEKGRRILSI